MSKCTTELKKKHPKRLPRLWNFKKVWSFQITLKLQNIWEIFLSCQNKGYTRLRKTNLKKNPDQILVHVRTNDLASNKYPEPTAESIIDVASSLKSDACDVSVLSLTVRNDQHRKKVEEVNIVWKELCKGKNYVT